MATKKVTFDFGEMGDISTCIRKATSLKNKDDSFGIETCELVKRAIFHEMKELGLSSFQYTAALLVNDVCEQAVFAVYCSSGEYDF